MPGPTQSPGLRTGLRRPRRAGRRTVVEAFVARRLLTIDAEHLEVTHEALLTAWPRLPAGSSEDAAGRAVRTHLAPEARDWGADGRPDDRLYRGARLAAAQEWLARADADPAAVERDFVAASAARSDDRARRSARPDRAGTGRPPAHPPAGRRPRRGHRHRHRRRRSGRQTPTQAAPTLVVPTPTGWPPHCQRPGRWTPRCCWRPRPTGPRTPRRPRTRCSPRSSTARSPVFRRGGGVVPHCGQRRWAHAVRHADREVVAWDLATQRRGS